MGECWSPPRWLGGACLIAPVFRAGFTALAPFSTPPLSRHNYTGIVGNPCVQSEDFLSDKREVRTSLFGTGGTSNPVDQGLVGKPPVSILAQVAMPFWFRPVPTAGPAAFSARKMVQSSSKLHEQRSKFPSALPCATGQHSFFFTEAGCK